MSPRVPVSVVAAWIPFLLVLPFNEGSGSPEGLLLAHLSFLLAVGATLASGARVSKGLALACLLPLAASFLSGARGGYLFASFLAVLDLAVILGSLLFLEAALDAGGRGGTPVLGSVALSGLVQSLLILAPWAASGFSRSGPGTMLNADHAGAYLALSFWALVALGDQVPIPAATAAGGCILAAALLQASRGVFLALLASGAVWLALAGPKLSRRARWGAASAALSVALLGGGWIAHRLETREDPYRWSRLNLWRVALRVAWEHPVLGAGPGLFTYVTAPLDLPRDGSVVRYSKHIESTHSDYLRVVAETGLVGTAAFLVLAVVVVRKGSRAARGGGAREAALSAGLAGVLVQMVVENLSARPAVSYTGAMLAAVLLTASRTSERRRRDGTRAVSRIAIGGAGLAWVGLALVVAPYLGHRAFVRFRGGGPEALSSLSASVFWNPIQPEYRAAPAELILATGTAKPGLLRDGLLAIDEAIALDPIEPQYYLVRARLARQAFLAGPGASDWIRIADDDYARAASLDPLRPQAHLERGWMLEALDRPEAALGAADAALSGEPDSFEARRLRATALVDLGRMEEARREAREARLRHEKDARLLPANAYEAQVLRWDEEGWRALDPRLGGG